MLWIALVVLAAALVLGGVLHLRERAALRAARSRILELEAVVHRLFGKVEIAPGMSAGAKDPKTELQEVLQGRKMRLPVYRVVGTLGAAHKQTFDVECEVGELGLVERGIGASRRAGEQAAAAAMLMVLKARLK